MIQTYLNRYIPGAGEPSMPPKAPAKPRAKKCRLIEGEAEVSGDDSSGNSEDFSEEETAEDRAMIDDSAEGARDGGRRRRKVRISEEEKRPDEDDFALVREACLERQPRRAKRDCKSKAAYADTDEDEDEVRDSDRDFISDDSDDGEEVRKQIRKYVARQGVSLAAPAAGVGKAAAKKAAYANTREMLKAQGKPAAAKRPACPLPMSKPRPAAVQVDPVAAKAEPAAVQVNPVAAKAEPARVKPTVKSRKPAEVFQPGAWSKSALAAAASKQAKRTVLYTPGFVVNPITKAVFYRRKDGTLEPRNGALET